MKFSFKELTLFDKILWTVSVVVVAASSLFAKDFNILSMIGAIIGVTALILHAKGKVIGQLLIIIFAIIYAVISFEQKYYGEMITYVGMSAPIAALSVYTWIKNPYEKANEVKVAKLSRTKWLVLTVLTIVVTIAFYFILKFLGTNSLLFSTLSVATSFFASSLTVLRNENYALAYAANDVVLIVLWVIASVRDISYISMIACFVMFLINDLYGFYSWRKMKKRQELNI